ncbi:MAG TPA: NADH-quinone oxidoreductase subunit C [Verrucomicrobiae bacterium]|nr:NADH-quinone oxidoreductase subunit C [Verrucomicrobiae bacterium]
MNPETKTSSQTSVTGPAESPLLPGSATAPGQAGVAELQSVTASDARQPSTHALSHLPIPFQVIDYLMKGYHLNATVQPDQVVFAARELAREGFALDTITGVDWLAAGQMEVVYDYFHPTQLLRVVVRSRIPRDHPEIPTISAVFPGANWHERETHDFFGIHFLGHPNLIPFLLPEDATFHPLRKDFSV